MSFYLCISSLVKGLILSMPSHELGTFDMHNLSTDEDDDVEEIIADIEDTDDKEDDRQSTLYGFNGKYTTHGLTGRGGGGYWFHSITGMKLFDPRSKWIREWKRVFLLVSVIGLFVDPLFFYSLSISDTYMCLFIDGWFAITVTALRCMSDALHVWNIWLQFKLVKNRSDYHVGDKPKISSINSSSSTSTARSVALNYLKAENGFFFDLFVIIPLPQLVLWVVTPRLLERGSTTVVMTVMLIMFLFQYLPKIYHTICLLRWMQSFSGYIYGTVWWGIALNMLAYFLASHEAGACWYLLGIQRAAKCLSEQSCGDVIYYGTTLSSTVKDRARLVWAEYKNVRSMCLESSDNFEYGAYKWTVSLVTDGSRLEKILFPIFRGLMTLSTFGNLESTTEWLEVVFNIIIIISGLLLVTMLIGNIKVCFPLRGYIQETNDDLKMRDIKWWMRRRQLPQGFRQRVRQYERQRFAAMPGVDECEMIRNLPEGPRKDIKYHLCLDLVRQVPLFQHMDDLVLENICDRVKSLIFLKGEQITREGDPVQRMLFIIRGHLQSSQILRDGVRSCCMLGPGNFSGDELLSWCLRRPFIERLPPSSSTLVTLETTEAFGLDAEDLKYVTQHFRYTFVNEKVNRSARYYSPGWRTWAAVAVQLAWRRYRHRLTLTSLSFIRPRRPLSRCSSLGEDRLRLYTALLTSPKPNQDDFCF
ncbi:hypothetical protein MKX01_021531 [Papaver californicum]|nr:hypothetical protein MKX01_021531 [Papaver californicum]